MFQHGLREAGWGRTLKGLPGQKTGREDCERRQGNGKGAIKGILMGILLHSVQKAQFTKIPQTKFYPKYKETLKLHNKNTNNPIFEMSKRCE